MVRFSIGAGDFSYLRCVRTYPEAQQVVCLMVNRDSDPGLRRPKLQDEDSSASSIDFKNAWSCTYVLFRFSWRSAKLTLILLTWKIRTAPNNASKWQMGFNSAFKGLSAQAFLPYGPNDIYKSPGFEPLSPAHYFSSVIKLPRLRFFYTD